MNNWEKSISELHMMLKTAEKNISSKSSQVLMIREGQVKKKQAKGKSSQAFIGKGKTIKTKKFPRKKKEEKVAKDATCYHCGERGHWRRNCPKYLADVKKGKAGTTSKSGIHMIELFAFASNSWVFDTGCGTHICNNVQGLKISKQLGSGDLDLHVGNGARVAVEAVGSFELLLPNGLYLILDNCCYVPSLTRSIISAARLVETGCSFGYSNGSILVYKSNMIYFEARPHNGIYEIDLRGLPDTSSVYTANTKRIKYDLNQTYLWHCRLGHINKKRIAKLQSDGILDYTDRDTYDVCESCLCGKMTKAPFSGTGERAKDLLGLIHTDVCGPFRTMSRSGERYFITFTDDFSRYGYVYLLKHKHEAFEMFKVFQNEVQNQLGKTIKIIRSDRGGEYLSQEFDDHLKNCGIVSQLTPPGTPQHNGVSERRNRTLLDMVRSMMSHTTLPPSFWSYALLSAAHILNMVPTKKVNKTPYEIWHGKVPKLSYLRVWGCEAHVKRDTLNKLESRTSKCIFVGYPRETMGYYFYNPTENKVFISRNAEFLEKQFLLNKASGSRVELDEVQDAQENTPETGTSNQQDVVEDEQVVVQNPEETQSLRRSQRVRHEPERYGFFIYDDEVFLVDQGEPTNYRDAISDSESDKWLNAMKAEMQSMYDNQVWDLVDLPSDKNAVGSKWVFKKKTDMDGNVHTYKARLVAKGFTQTHGIDYDEIFAPVAMLKSIRM